MDREAALEYAVQHSQQAADVGVGAGATADPSRLTTREREVAKLVALGRSNREIAQALVIAPSTAERHVANILGKLQLDSRVQIAAWVLEQR
jgi:DNA-binding NarL/FixJ family response regulator